MTGPRLVVIGASLAGLRAAETARRLGHRGPVVMIGAERHHPYDRPPLSKQVLTGRVDPAATALPPPVDLEAEWRLGTAATGLDLGRRLVTLDDGPPVGWDLLVLSTGARPRTLPDQPTLAGLHTFRTLEDAVAVRAELMAGGRLVVVGAGFIGLEVAASARALGCQVTVLETAPLPLGRAVGGAVGRFVAEWHRAEGVDLRLRTAVTGFADDGRGRVTGVRVERDGRRETIAADVVVVGVGVVPTTAWLEGSGLDLDDGLRTDVGLRVLARGRAVPGIVAAGDLVRADDGEGGTVRHEHWTAAADQAVTAAATLLGAAGPGSDRAPSPGPGGAPYVWSDQYGRKLQMVGRPRPGDEEALVDGSFEERRFAVAYGRAGRIVAAVGLGRPARIMALQRDIAAGQRWHPVR